jgi:3-oxoacyl-[acyl-carrier protein] reductase
MDLGLSGVLALILDSDGLLGPEIARTLASEGAVVALAVGQGRRSPGRTWIDADSAIHVFEASLESAASRDELMRSVEAVVGLPAVLVCVAASPSVSDLEALGTHGWTVGFDSVVTPIADIGERIVPAMRARGWGRIVTLVASDVMEPDPDEAGSGVFQAPLLMWSKAIATSFGAEGVTSNVIVLGPIDCPGASIHVPQTVPAAHRQVPAGRMGTVEEVSATVAFLAGQYARHMNGAVIRVDGGLVRSW